MATQALLPLLLLCALLLQAQGGLYNRKEMQNIKACEKRPSVYLCNDHCSYYLSCSKANTICSPTF